MNDYDSLSVCCSRDKHDDVADDDDGKTHHYPKCGGIGLSKQPNADHGLEY